eukprot:scaffold78836_cov21-Tisochrysis_lutea.AAC.2
MGHHPILLPATSPNLPFSVMLFFQCYMPLTEHPPASQDPPFNTFLSIPLLHTSSCSVSPSSLTIQAHGQQKVSVTYAPLLIQEGPESATITLRSNDIGQWDYNIEGAHEGCDMVLVKGAGQSLVGLANSVHGRVSHVDLSSCPTATSHQSLHARPVTGPI